MRITGIELDYDECNLKNIMYTVTYSSFYFSDCNLYAESQVFNNKADAMQAFSSYIAEILEDANGTIDVSQDESTFEASSGGDSFWYISIREQ